MIKVYVASKAKHGAMWQAFRKILRATDYGMEITSTWIDEYEPSATYDYVSLWTRCIEESGDCDLLIAYHEPGEVWKGAFVEIGAALQAGKPVYVVGLPPGTWTHHPLVSTAFDIYEAIDDYIGSHT